MLPARKVYKVQRKTRHGIAVMKNHGAWRAWPPFQPGGTPSVTTGNARVEIEVVNCPSELVVVKVISVGEGEIVGKAVTLNML